MSFQKMKTWDNRTRPIRMDLVTGRSWSRRIQWLEDAQGRIKLKFEDGTNYKEVIVAGGRVSADTMWARFKEGQSIEDSISILGQEPAQHLQSRRCHQ